MKPAIVYPNPLGTDLADAPASAEAGAKGLVCRPEVFVDDSFGLRVDPAALGEAFAGAGLELAALWPKEALIDGEGSVDAGATHLRGCVDLADALREHARPDAVPVVVFDAGPGERDALWSGLVEALKGLAKHAEERAVCLAVRPDRGTVVERSRTALKLLGEVGSSYLQAAMDAAATVGDKDTLDSAVERLKENVLIAFARDVKFDEAGKPSYPAPGEGVLNYGQYAELLSKAPGCAWLAVGEVATPEEAKAALAKVGALVG
jgi:sugar phosphate isomerase/epimerase